VQCKRYDEAADMKDLADKTEEKERREHEIKFMKYREQQRKIILRDHYNALACFDERSETNLARIKQELELELEMRRKALENLRKKLAYLQSLIQTEFDVEMKVSLAKKKPVMNCQDVQWNAMPDTFVTEPVRFLGTGSPPVVSRRFIDVKGRSSGSGLCSMATQTRERYRFLGTSEV
jgi:hypothetical protein